MEAIGRDTAVDSLNESIILVSTRCRKVQEADFLLPRLNIRNMKPSRIDMRQVVQWPDNLQDEERTWW